MEFDWSKQCQSAFDHVKRSLSSTDVLAHHDLTKPIGISCDASKFGLGVVLFHRETDNTECPIAYASKVLSPAESRYSQIEKEGLSIVFGIKKFFQFLCGRQFTVITDHKPLLSIFGSSAVPSFIATRLNKWSLFLSQFQFDIKYRNTKDHGNADALSRLTISASKSVSEEEPDVIHLLASETLHVLPVTAKRIRQFSSRDKVLSIVYRYVEGGWPSHLLKSEEHLQPYFIRRNELSIEQGVLLWGIRVVVPQNLRPKLKEELHASHSELFA